MASMNISLPDPMREFVEDCVKKDGYQTASEYFRELVRADQKRKEQERLEKILLAAIDSGKGRELDDSDWENIKSHIKKKFPAKAKNRK